MMIEHKKIKVGVLRICIFIKYVYKVHWDKTNTAVVLNKLLRHKMNTLFTSLQILIKSVSLLWMCRNKFCA